MVGGIYPFFVQSVQVHPSEPDKEAPYIQRNIDATVKAYGLDAVQAQDYDGVANVKTADRCRCRRCKNIRLIDPAVVSPTFKQLQQNRGFYVFADTLDVDRYVLPDATRPTARGRARVRGRRTRARPERSPAGPAQLRQRPHRLHPRLRLRGGLRQPVPRRRKPELLRVQHPAQGAPADRAAAGLLRREVPDVLHRRRPFGQDPGEFDYPTDTESTSGQSNYTYTGNGGVADRARCSTGCCSRPGSARRTSCFPTGSTPSRQILYDRDPRDRVEKVAPYLTVDGDAYPAVVDGRIDWIVDGYTTANGYPYSAAGATLGDATADSLTAANRAVALPNSTRSNYIRNSVKATVDAYDGTVTLYAWDEQDPVLKAWQRVFPDVGEAEGRDVRRAHGARAVPGGPVQGPARAVRAATT